MSANRGYPNTAYWPEQYGNFAAGYPAPEYARTNNPGNWYMSAAPRPDYSYYGNPGPTWPQVPPCYVWCCACRGFCSEPRHRPFPPKHDDGKRDREEQGAIIPYASGPAGTLTFNAGTQLSTGVAVAFGASVSGIPITGGAINVNSIDNMAFSMPRNGVITSIAAFFSVSAPVTLGAPVTINAQLYASETPDNTFSPLGSAVALTPPLTGLVTLGSVASAVDRSQRLSVRAGTRLLLVFYALSQAMVTATTTITGYFSGGLEIK
jgi:BclB C-terminal domain-containing protein